ncbi:MAG: signal peptidase I [Patescibacteria group bacterium]
MEKTFKYFNYFFALILICAAIFLAYIAVPYFGNKALIVKTGSMSPKIKAGDLVIINAQKILLTPAPIPLATYHTGDVIAFKDLNNPNVLITHRIIKSEVKNSEVYFQTKGDANNSPDTALVPQKNIIGKSTFTIPQLGKLFAFAKTKQGFALLVLIPAVLVILIEVTTLIKESIKIQRARRMLQQDPDENVEKRELLGPIGLRILMPFVVGLMFFHNTYAFFSDSASSINNTFTAASTFPSPSPSGEATPSATPGTSPTPTPSPTNIANHLLISEVQITGGPEHTTEDFIELYNPTSSNISLNGFKLVNRTTASLTDNSIRVFTTQTIPAHGYFLWCSSTKATLITCDDSTTDTLANDGSVAIRQGELNTGTIIDALSWDSSVSSLKEGTEFFPNPGANQSLERKAFLTSDAASMAGADLTKGNGFDTDNNSTDFILKISSEPQNSTSSTETP